MLNIPELEKRWLHYKIKSYIPYVVIFISLIIITIIATTFLTDTSDTSSTYKKTIPTPIVEPTDIKSVKVVPIKNNKVIIQDKVIHIQQVSKKKTQLAPSMEFMKNMQNSTQPYYDNETFNSPIKKEKIKEEIVETEIEEEVVEPIKVDNSTKKIQIKRQNTQNDIQEIISRFKKNNNPALSLFVAKKYYELGDYHKSYNYALMTNEINRDIEASWIIFAKSLVKLGEKDLAIKTLKKFIKQSHSNSAKILLDEIRSGKFK